LNLRPWAYESPALTTELLNISKVQVKDLQLNIFFDLK
jgi:hypothetical protein